MIGKMCGKNKIYGSDDIWWRKNLGRRLKGKRKGYI